MNGGGPGLLLTRPLEQSRGFLATCEARLGHPIEAVISPLIEIVGTGIHPDLDRACTIVVTSGNAVRILGQGLEGRVVVTVGSATADLAQSHGARVLAVAETVQDLLSKAETLIAPVLVCRGVHARVDLSAELNVRGIEARDSTIYDQVAIPLSNDARNALLADRVLVAPVFSPRSARLLSIEPRRAPLIVPAISQAAAENWEGDADIRIARAPSAAAMADLVAEAL